MKLKRRLVLLSIAMTVSLAAAWPIAAFAATQPRLGTATNFAVLAGSTITNTGSSVVNGDLGLSPGSAVTGFPPGVVNGGTHIADGVALQAKNDLVTAYNDAANQTPFVDMTGVNLGNQNLSPGVYHFSSSVHLTPPLTLRRSGCFLFALRPSLRPASASLALPPRAPHASRRSGRAAASQARRRRNGWLGRLPLGRRVAIAPRIKVRQARGAVAEQSGAHMRAVIVDMVDRLEDEHPRGVRPPAPRDHHVEFGPRVQVGKPPIALPRQVLQQRPRASGIKRRHPPPGRDPS